MYREFDDVDSYLWELQGDSFLAILPLQQAGEALKISRAAVSQRITGRKLDGIRIGRTTYVCAQSIFAILRQDDENVRTLRKFLEGVAKAGKTSHYSEVMPLVGLSPKIPNDRGVIGRLLGKVSEQTHREKKPVLLSALVFNQTLKRPSDSFYGLASNLGYDDADDEDFLQKHLKKIYRRYSGK